jgi:hypothetical protein
MTGPAVPATPVPGWSAPQPTTQPPVQPRQKNPLRGWLIAILACLVVSLVIQGVTLSLLVPHLVTTTYPDRAVTLVAVSTGVDSTVTVASQQATGSQPLTTGQRLSLPVVVISDQTVSILVTAVNPSATDARITCQIVDSSGKTLAESSAVVGSTPSVQCAWANNGR